MRAKNIGFRIEARKKILELADVLDVDKDVHLHAKRPIGGGNPYTSSQMKDDFETLLLQIIYRNFDVDIIRKQRRDYLKALNRIKDVYGINVEDYVEEAWKRRR